MSVGGHCPKIAGRFPRLHRSVDSKLYFYRKFPADVAGELEVVVVQHQGSELLPVRFADRRADRPGWTGIPLHCAEDEGRKFNVLAGRHNRKLTDGVKEDKNSYMLMKVLEE